MLKNVLIILLVITIAGCSRKNNEKKELTISVAASLQKPVEKIKTKYESLNKNIKININSGSSGTLKNQIIQGSPVDIYFTADVKFADDLIKEKYINENEKIDLLKNSLVVIKNKNIKTILNSPADLKNIEGKISTGEPETVPAGKYAKEFLTSTGIFKDIESKIIFAKNVSFVKTYVESGEVDFGIVYKSDATELKNSEIALKIDNTLHSDIIYSIAVINKSKNIEEAKKFVDFIKSEESKKIFTDFGFEL